MAAAHGRFQPLHNEHLQYLVAASALCDTLVIGVTQPVNSHLLGGNSSHRGEATHNPLTFYERAVLIRAALLDAGLKPGTFHVVPFPIDAPSLMADFIPNSLPMITTICDEWNRRKIRTLDEQKYHCHVLWEREAGIRSSTIRRMLLAGDPTWESLVPSATIEYIEAWRVADRVGVAIETRQQDSE